MKNYYSMKKFVVSLICVVLTFISCKSLFAQDYKPSVKELNVATKYFSILYDYDILAAQYSQSGNQIKSVEELNHLYNTQKSLTVDTLNKLKDLKPVENYNNSYALVLSALESQIEYLEAMQSSLRSGLTFDQAFAINSWNFLAAQKYLKEGVALFQEILESYDVNYQQKIISTKIKNEQQIYTDLQNCSYVDSLQDTISR